MFIITHNTRQIIIAAAAAAAAAAVVVTLLLLECLALVMYAFCVSCVVRFPRSRAVAVDFSECL